MLVSCIPPRLLTLSALMVLLVASSGAYSQHEVVGADYVIDLQTDYVTGLKLVCMYPRFALDLCD